MVFTSSGPSDTSIVEHFVHDVLLPESLSSTYVIGLLKDSQGRMWVGTSDGINLLTKDDQFINYRTDKSFPFGQIVDIVEQPANNKVWVCAREAPYPLYLFNENNAQLEPFKEFAPSENRSFRITFDHQNRMWASVRSIGLFVHDFSTGQTQFYDPDKGAHHGFRTYGSARAMTDSYGNVWIGGTELLKWPNSHKPFQSILSDGYLVNSVFADEHFIWYSARKPFRWNRATLRTEQHLPEGQPINLRVSELRNPEKAIIYKYAAVDENSMLFTTTRNIFFWDRRDDTFTQIPTSRGGPFRDFEFGQNNNLWITPNQGALVELDLSTGRDTSLAERGHNKIPYPMTIASDSSGYLWIGSTRNGLFRFNEETLETINYVPAPGDSVPSLSSYYVRDILVHSDGTLWIGTNLGLDHFDPGNGSFINFNKSDGLASDNIVSIAEDDHGNLWMGTHEGLIKMTYQSKSFDRFTQSAGLCNTVYTDRAVFKDPSGWMYFGGNNGVDFFHPDSIGINSIPPAIYISAVRVHNKPVATDLAYRKEFPEMQFRYDENFIEIEFVGLHYTTPSANTYAYKLEGPAAGSGTWNELGTSRLATLGNMSPGGYTLHARAANPDGVWSEEKVLLKFQISPPFWRTLWFYALIAFLIICGLTTLYLLRIRQIQQKERLKSEFNKKIAEIELKALQAQMNPHFLFNSLNSVKSLIGKKENRKATLYLTRFSQLIRQVLNNSMSKFVKLSDELEALRLYLDLESMRFQDKFDFQIEVGEDVNADFVEVPPLLLQPYVENAIWHGLLPKENGQRLLTVEVRRSGDFIQMMVEDNGIGRKNAQQLRSKTGNRRQSLGMRITDDRLKILHAIYGSEARVEVQDLTDPTGTRVTIHLPLAD